MGTVILAGDGKEQRGGGGGGVSENFVIFPAHWVMEIICIQATGARKKRLAIAWKRTLNASVARPCEPRDDVFQKPAGCSCQGNHHQVAEGAD